MTRLARHDEIVERMARAILDATLWPGAWLKANEVETNAAKRGAARATAMNLLKLRLTVFTPPVPHWRTNDHHHSTRTLEAYERTG